MIVGLTPQEVQIRTQLADIFSYAGFTLCGATVGYYLTTDEKVRKGKAKRRRTKQAFVGTLMGAGAGLALAALTNPWLRNTMLNYD